MKHKHRNISLSTLKKIKRDAVKQPSQSMTNEMIERIYSHVTTQLQKDTKQIQKDLSDKIYNCIAKQLHNELVQFKDYTEKYLNQRITNEFNLIKRELTLILNDQQPKDMSLDREEIPLYYS